MLDLDHIEEREALLAEHTLIDLRCLRSEVRALAKRLREYGGGLSTKGESAMKSLAQDMEDAASDYFSDAEAGYESLLEAYEMQEGMKERETMRADYIWDTRP